MTTETDYRRITATPDECALVDAFLSADGAFVSGSGLAQQLGVSRPAIKAKLEKLKGKGYDFEAVRNRGYRLIRQPDVLEPALLRHHLKRLGCPIEPLYFPVIDSTNSEAERQLSHGRTAPFAVLSSCQTKGRGRLGREWHSASADSLYLSVLFTPNIPPQQLQHFTLWAGVHICRILQALVPSASLKVKWPNDLLCEGRKFAGMLTEARMDADRINSIIFGIGINVNSNPMSFPPDLRTTATSLHAVRGAELPINSVAAQVLLAIRRAYDSCIRKADSESLLDAWPALDALAGRQVTAFINGNAVVGVASGIDDSGALLLKAPSGRITSVRAGDVTLKK